MHQTPPHFTYHPKAYELEVIEAIDIECECCGQRRGWIYSGNVHCIADVDNVCPWCIADGSAHRKWDASFSQDIEGVTIDGDAQIDGASPQAVDAVMHHTPGYSSWQGAVWKTHCDDVCEFHGDISPQELASLPPDAEALFRQDHGWLFRNHPTLRDLAEHYRPQGDLSLYKFLCRHCGIVRLHADLS